MRRSCLLRAAATVALALGPLALGPLALSSPALDVTSRLAPRWSSSRVEIGSEVFYRITVTDEERSGLELPKTLTLGPEWSVVSGPRAVNDSAEGPLGRSAAAVEWTLMPLAGGVLTVPELAIGFDDGSTALVPPATLNVQEALGESEDSPRPLLGFREVADRRLGDPRTALLAAGGLLGVLLLLGLFLRARRRGRDLGPAPNEGPSPRAQLLALGESATLSHSPGAVMESLGPLFRRAMDAPLAEEVQLRRAALTDEAWALELDSPEARGLMEELSAYRYGGGSPTSFAAKDAWERARKLLESAPSRGASQGELEVAS